MSSKAKQLACAVGLSLAIAPAFAGEAGDMIIRAGLASVNPASDNGPTVTVDNATGLGISLTYMVSPSVGVELLGASPFEHDIKLASNDTRIGKTSHLPPTLLLNYHFPVSGPISAYLGAGINHTVFFEEEIDPAVAQNIELDASTGLALQFGTNFQLTQAWGVSLAWWHIDIDTDATLTAADGNRSKIPVEIDPWVVMVGGSFRF